jgi:outer membrane protein assembly factor BamB
MRLLLAVLFVAFSSDVLHAQSLPATAWPGFRCQPDGSTKAGDLPVEWAARGRRNFAWTVRLPGYGQSCPVIWGGRVFVTSVAGEEKEQLLLTCLDLASGKEFWQREYAGTQHVADGDTVSRGAPTPAVDARAVYAFYESGDLIAADHDGRELWKRSLVAEYGEFQGPHGYASSPAIASDRMIVQVSHKGPSYVVAIDKFSGKNLWKIDLPSATAWSSPVVVEGEGIAEPIVLVSSSGSLQAIALADGSPRWQISDLKGNTTPTPATDGQLVVVGSSDPGFTRAFRLGGSGDVSQSHLAWSAEKSTCGYASPLIHRGHVYFVGKTGIATCHNLATGEVCWTERLPGACWASPLGAGDRVYFVTKDGTTAVVQAGPKFELLAENELSFTDVAYGIAAVDGSLLIRAGRSLARVTTRADAGP